MHRCAFKRAHTNLETQWSYNLTLQNVQSKLLLFSTVSLVVASSETRHHDSEVMIQTSSGWICWWWRTSKDYYKVKQTFSTSILVSRLCFLVMFTNELLWITLEHKVMSPICVWAPAEQTPVHVYVLLEDLERFFRKLVKFLHIYRERYT